MRMELPVARHSFYAFFPGISVRAYTDEQLRQINEESEKTHTWHGKEYNAYEASQQQRRMETKMRAQRAEVKALQRGDGCKDDINAAKSRYLNTLHQYQAFSKKMNLPEQMERVYMDGLGRMVSGRVPKFIGNASRVSNIKKATAANIITVHPVYGMDTATAINIQKNLKKSITGKGVLDYIVKNNTTVDVIYNDNQIMEMSLEGLHGRAIGNHIYINGKSTQSIVEIAKTIIHEEKHIELLIGGDQHAEAVCDYFAELHVKGALTGKDIRSIIKSVKERYPDYKWRV